LSDAADREDTVAEALVGALHASANDVGLETAKTQLHDVFVKTVSTRKRICAPRPLQSDRALALVKSPHDP
jgi:hypothetical protein